MIQRSTNNDVTSTPSSSRVEATSVVPTAEGVVMAPAGQVADNSSAALAETQAAPEKKRGRKRKAEVESTATEAVATGDGSSAGVSASTSSGAPVAANATTINISGPVAERVFKTPRTKSGRAVQKPDTFTPATAAPTTNTAHVHPAKKRRGPTKKKDTSILCARCHRGSSRKGNEIVYCDKCSGTWHQKCQDPLIPKSVIEDEDAKWFCSACTNAALLRKEKSLAKKEKKLELEQQQQHLPVSAPIIKQLERPVNMSSIPSATTPATAAESSAEAVAPREPFVAKEAITTTAKEASTIPTMATEPTLPAPYPRVPIPIADNTDVDMLDTINDIDPSLAKSEFKLRRYLLSLRKETLIDLLVLASNKHKDIKLRLPNYDPVDPLYSGMPFAESIEDENTTMLPTAAGTSNDDEGYIYEEIPLPVPGAGIKLPRLSEDIDMLLEKGDADGAISHKVRGKKTIAGKDGAPPKRKAKTSHTKKTTSITPASTSTTTTLLTPTTTEAASVSAGKIKFPAEMRLTKAGKPRAKPGRKPKSALGVGDGEGAAASGVKK